MTCVQRVRESVLGGCNPMILHRMSLVSSQGAQDRPFRPQLSELSTKHEVFLYQTFEIRQSRINGAPSPKRHR